MLMRTILITPFWIPSLLFGIYMSLMLTKGISAEVRDSSADVLTFKNGYQVSGKVEDMNIEKIRFQKKQGGTVYYPIESIKFICYHSSYRGCSLSTPGQRFWRSLLLPGLGQSYGRQYGAAWAFGILNYTFLGLSAYLYSEFQNANKLANEKVDNRISHQDRITDLNNNNKKADSAYNSFQAVFLVTTLIYILQLYHAYNNGFVPLSLVKKDFEIKATSNLEKMQYERNKNTMNEDTEFNTTLGNDFETFIPTSSTTLSLEKSSIELEWASLYSKRFTQNQDIALNYSYNF